MAIWVVWQRMSISSGYLSEIPWVRKRMGYLFCLWRTLRETWKDGSISWRAPAVFIITPTQQLLTGWFDFSWKLNQKRVQIFKHFQLSDAFRCTNLNWLKLNKHAIFKRQCTLCINNRLCRIIVPIHGISERRLSMVLSLTPINGWNHSYMQANNNCTAM